MAASKGSGISNAILATALSYALEMSLKETLPPQTRTIICSPMKTRFDDPRREYTLAGWERRTATLYSKYSSLFFKYSSSSKTSSEMSLAAWAQLVMAQAQSQAEPKRLDSK